MTVLLERGQELAILRSAVLDAAPRHGSVVSRAGEAGIGRSSLTRAWTAASGVESARVLVDWCDDFPASRTLGPLRDIARADGGDQPGAEPAGRLSRERLRVGSRQEAAARAVALDGGWR